MDGETKLNVSSGTSCDLLIYSTTKTFEEKRIIGKCRRTHTDNSVLLPSDVVDFVICLLRDLGWETVFLLDIIGPPNYQWEPALFGKKFQLYIAVKKLIFVYD